MRQNACGGVRITTLDRRTLITFDFLIDCSFGRCTKPFGHSTAYIFGLFADLFLRDWYGLGTVSVSGSVNTMPFRNPGRSSSDLHSCNLVREARLAWEQGDEHRVLLRQLSYFNASKVA